MGSSDRTLVGVRVLLENPVVLNSTGKRNFSKTILCGVVSESFVQSLRFSGLEDGGICMVCLVL